MFVVFAPETVVKLKTDLKMVYIVPKIYQNNYEMLRLESSPQWNLPMSCHMMMKEYFYFNKNSIFSSHVICFKSLFFTQSQIWVDFLKSVLLLNMFIFKAHGLDAGC